MKIFNLITIATLVSIPVHFANAASDWVEIAENNTGGKWSIKAGSLEISKTKSGTPIAVVIGRIMGIRGGEIQLYKWYVPLKDCIEESGTVVTLNMSGSYQFENDFVFNAGNISSAMAEAICGAATIRVTNQREKSL